MIFEIAAMLFVLFLGIALVTVCEWWTYGAVLCFCVMLMTGGADNV